MLRQNGPSRRPVGRLALLAIILSTILITIAAGSNAAVFSFVDSVNRLVGFGPNPVITDDISAKVAAKRSTACITPPAGMVSWWPGDGNNSDIIGTNNGITEGNLTYSSAKVLQGFNFDGTTADIRIPASTSLDVGARGPMTIDMWIKPTTVTNNPLAEWGSGVTGAHFWLGGSEVPGNLYINLTDTGGNYHILQSAGGVVVPNQWQHVAMTYDSASGIAAIYLNGSIVAGPTNLGSFTPRTNSDLYLGLRVSPAYRFSGVMDEVELFDRALSQSDIQAIYNAGSAGKCKPQCTPPPSGMVSWWPGDGNANDIQGPTFENGTLEGSFTFPSGKVAQAFGFNGSDSDVKIPAAASIDVGTGGGMTIDLWIRPSDVYLRPLVEWNSNGAIGTYFWIGGQPSSGSLDADLVDVTGNHHVISSTAGLITTNTWQHVAVTYDKSSGVATLYLNGSVVGGPTTLGSFTPQTSYDLYLGSRPPGSSRYVGQMDEVEIFNRALDTVEVAAIYNAGSAGKCRTCTPPPANMVNWWTGDGNANDIQGGANGTLVGGTTFAAGKVGQAFSFDGVDDRVDAPAGVGDFGSNAFTVDFWMKSNTNGAHNSPTFILGKDNAGGALGWDIRQGDNTIRVVGVNGWGFNITRSLSG